MMGGSIMQMLADNLHVQRIISKNKKIYLLNSEVSYNDDYDDDYHDDYDDDYHDDYDDD